MLSLVNNKEIFSYEDILMFNNILLQRGDPSQKDDIGYNKPDYSVCIRYYYGLSNEQLADLTERLIKYCKTQLGIDAEKMKATATYYKSLSKAENGDLSKHVSVDIDDKFVRIAFKYNTDFISVMNNEAKTAKYIHDDKAYLLDKREALYVLNKLKNKGAVCDNAINYLLENGIIDDRESLVSELSKIKSSKYKINLTQHNDDFMEVSFKYDSVLVNCVKALKQRKFNVDSKSWLVHKSELKTLKNLIIDAFKNNLQYDLSDFNKYTNNTVNQESKCSHTPLSKIDCVEGKKGNFLISFDYNPDIVKLIKTLNTSEWNASLKAWNISKLELPLLYEKLLSVKNEYHLDLSSVKECLNKLNSIYDKFKDVKLIDTNNLTRKPFIHQIQAAEFLLNNKTAMLCDEQGLGKTTSSILAAASIRGKKLVICPASLKLNWKKEIELISKEPIFVVDSSKFWESCKGWTIINYDIIEKFKEKIMEEKYTVLIGDEIHYIKSISNSGKADSIRAANVLEISQDIPFIFALTGTPIPNHTKDIFNILSLIRHPLSSSFYKFAQRYCGAKYNGYGWDFNGSSNREELNEILNTCMVRRLKKEAIDLPKKLRSFIPLEIDLKEYNKSLDEYFKERKNYTNKEQHLVKLNALKHILAKEKIKHTVEIADNLLLQNRPVVIFTEYSTVIDTLVEHYKDNCVVIQGSTSFEERQEAIEKFQGGDVQVFIGNIKAAGVGITLTRSSDLIFNDYSFTPAHHQQAEDRVHRIGQNETCNIYYMYAANAEIDEILTTMLDKKLSNISKIVDGLEVDFVDEVIKNFQDKQIRLNIS